MESRETAGWHFGSSEAPPSCNRPKVILRWFGFIPGAFNGLGNLRGHCDITASVDHAVECESSDIAYLFVAGYLIVELLDCHVPLANLPVRTSLVPTGLKFCLSRPSLPATIHSHWSAT